MSPGQVRPYADAPRLPDGERIDLKDLVKGTWFEIEVGPGRGGFLIERAAAAPEAGLIGLEIRRKWATIVDTRLRKLGFGGSARVFAEDAKHALARLGPNASVRRVFLHFPDPWWKKRHHKRLVMGTDFLGEVIRLLEPHGELFVQTDVEERATAYEALLSQEPALEAFGDSGAHLDDNPYEARSPRERRAIADGLPVTRLRFRKRG